MVNMMKSKEKLQKSNDEKHKRRRLRVGDPDFVPPDGGWGWFIVFACGFSNLSTFPMFQQFGLVFRAKFEELGITQTQTTTVINLNSAFNASVGLLNGPVFRKFSYRQVAMFGSSLVGISLLTTTYCDSFWMYVVFYSICYGCGIGITQSSNALALNTYFKDKRRIATGLSWSTTALGPIVWPYIITALLELYGVEGTLALFSAFAWHAFMCSLLLHPVEWHTKYKEVEDQKPASPLINSSEKLPLPEDTLTIPSEKPSKRHKKSVFSRQYLKNEDDPVDAGYEITDPGTPMMVRSNDGWYSQKASQAGSRISLVSNKTNKGSKATSAQNSQAVSKRSSYSNLNDARSKRNSSVNLEKDGKDYRKRERKSSYSKAPIREEAEEGANEALLNQKTVPTAPVQNNLQLPNSQYPHEKDTLKSAAKKLEEYEQTIKEAEELEIVNEVIRQEELRKQELLDIDESDEHQLEDEKERKLSFCEKVYIFFDFDLFRDPIYVNLMLGITIANFAELNFSILTPMVLTEFHFGKYQIATFMSLLGATDILIRFFVPFIADRIGWDNKTFFLFGVLNMAIGRIILVHTRTYEWSLLVAVLIGAGKGLRTIFMALVIPGHVSLERLPAASGLQLATSGLLFVALGPVVGWIQDMTGSYTITLHLLNICTYTTAVAWTLERIITNRRKSVAKKHVKTDKAIMAA